MPTLKIKLHKCQRVVADDPHRFKIICAGRRWGKSVLSRMIMLKWASANPGLYWIVSPTFQQGHDIHWMQGYKAEMPDSIVTQWNDSVLSVTLTNGSIIQVKSADQPDRLKGVKLRGLIVDEIATMRNWEWIWQEALRPTLTDYSAPAIFISTPKGYNHFYRLFQQGLVADSNFKSFQFTSYDNPFVPASEIDQAKKDLEDDYFMQEYMADFRKYTGLVYKDFDRGVHVKEIEDFRPVYWLVGIDRGFTNPTAVCLIEVNKDGDWYQTHELYQSGWTNPQLFNNIYPLIKGKNMELSTMDSAQASDIQELLDISSAQEANLDLIPVIKQPHETGTNYIRWKITKFSERLKPREGRPPRYMVHPRCVNTIAEFETYRWKEKKNADEDNQENPEKVSDHMMDAISDLNAMYEHYYSERSRKPWEGKIPGTYIPPSVPDEDENQWGADGQD